MKLLKPIFLTWPIVCKAFLIYFTMSHRNMACVFPATRQHLSSELFWDSDPVASAHTRRSTVPGRMSRPFCARLSDEPLLCELGRSWQSRNAVLGTPH